MFAASLPRLLEPAAPPSGAGREATPGRGRTATSVRAHAPRSPGARARQGNRPAAVPLLLLVVALAVLLTAPAPALGSAAPHSLGSAAAPRAPPSEIGPRPTVNGFGTPVNFSPLGSAAPLPSEFFGSTVTVDSGIVGNESQFIQATPARMLVWPGGGFGDRYDAIAGILHGHLAAPGPAPSNESAFVTLCRSVGCHAIFQVPGEINSTAFAAQVVAYTEQTLGFHPDYWEIGNEPALWHHFGLPWAEWNRTQLAAPTPQQYAEEVLAYGQAMRAVDPSIRILGLPGVGLGGKVETAWMSAVASLDGSWIAGLAIHTYPAGIGPKSASLPGFLATLGSANSLPTRVPLDRAALNASCGRCASLPIFVTEIGSAVLSGTYDPYVEGFPDAVYLGAEAVQAVELNLTNIDTFAVRFTNPGSWENATSSVRPSYALFSDLLSRLGGEVQPLQDPGGPAGVYALESVRGSAPRVTDLFVDNSNSTTGIQFAPASIPGFASGPAETWTWDGSTNEPVPNYWPSGLPASWSVPPVGLLLVESSSPGSVPLTATETGLSPGSQWYLAVDGQLETSRGPEMTFFLTAGTFPVLGDPVKGLPNGGRVVEFAPGSVVVGSAPCAISVDFRVQYLLLIEATPSGGGVTQPDSGWYNSTAPVPLQAVARSGYVFTSWTDSAGNGYSGSQPNTSLMLSGRTVEIANFTSVGPTPDPPAGNPSGHPSSGLSRSSLIVPLAIVLIVAAVGLNFHRRKDRPASGGTAAVTAPAPPATKVSDTGPRPPRRAPPASTGPRVEEARRRQVLDRVHRLTQRAAELTPGTPGATVAIAGLRRSLELLRASQFDAADQVLSETERKMESAA